MNKSIIKSCQTLKALFGHEVNGITCQEIAKQSNRHRSAIIKELQSFETAGFAEQLPDKRWRLSSGLAREAIKILNGLEAARKRVEEANARYQ